MKLGETLVLGLVLLAVIVLVWKNINDKSVKKKVAVLDIAVPTLLTTVPGPYVWSQPAGTTIQEIYIKCTGAIGLTSSGNAGYAVTVGTSDAIVTAAPTGLASSATSVALGTLVSPTVISTYATTTVKRDVTLTFTHNVAVTGAGVLHVVIVYF